MGICLEPFLLLDLGLPALMDLNPDPSLAGVTFEPPTKITETDLRLSGESSDSSSSSSSSPSSCDTVSDDEFNLTHFEPLQIAIPGLAAEKEKGNEPCESTNSKEDSKDKRKRKEETTVVKEMEKMRIRLGKNMPIPKVVKVRQRKNQNQKRLRQLTTETNKAPRKMKRKVRS